MRPVFRLGNGAVEQTESESFLFLLLFQHILIILGTFVHTLQQAFSPYAFTNTHIRTYTHTHAHTHTHTHTHKGKKEGQRKR